MRYPLNIAQSKDYIKFQFGKYESPFKAKTTSGEQTAYQSKVTLTPVGDAIYLPMPSDIGSAFQGNWGGKDVTGLAQVALGTVGGAAGDIFRGDPKTLGNRITGLFNLETVKNAGGGLLADGLTALATKFSEVPGMGANLGANDVLQLTSETIVNPNTELLYSGTGLRTHGYSFKMIPQSKDEAEEVFKIVEAFKVACAPKSSSAVFGSAFKNFIGIPDLCQVSFISGSTDNKYLPRYKVSAITSVNVGYVTDGQFVAYREGHPLGVSLSVSLTETKLVFSEEIGSGSDKYR